MDGTKIIILVFWLIPPLIIIYLFVPAIIPMIDTISEAKSPDGKLTAIVADEQYGNSFGPANYTVDIKFRAALLHYVKTRILETGDGSGQPPQVAWKDSNHLNIKIVLKDKSYIQFQAIKSGDIDISYEFTFKDSHKK